MSLTHFLFWIRSRFWYLPSLYGFIAAILALISLSIDKNLSNYETLYSTIPSVLLSDINLSRTILSTISASLLTMTTITFSTILVVLTTYLSEYSPRTLQNFITDRSTQRVLGIFVGGFIYSILLLVLLKESETAQEFFVPSFAVLFAIVCLMVFVFFIHHVTSWIQVSNLIHAITLNILDKIENDLKDQSEVNNDAPWEDWESEEILHIEPSHIRGVKSGYVQHIDIDGIVKQATDDDCIIRVEKKVGEYVDKETPLLSLWTLDQHRINGHYEKYISTGTKKIAYDDLEFGLIKIVEIALRALSTGINDPNTAINCIENLAKILAELGKKQLPRAYHNDQERNLRLILEKSTYSDYLYRCFYQIRQYGSNDISVLSSLIDALTFIAESNYVKVKEIIWEFSQYIIEGIDQQSLLSLDKRYINDKLKGLSRATGHYKDFKPLS
jgi:uncharacterized membrane protein